MLRASALAVVLVVAGPAAGSEALARGAPGAFTSRAGGQVGAARPGPIYGGPLRRAAFGPYTHGRRYGPGGYGYGYGSYHGYGYPGYGYPFGGLPPYGYGDHAPVGEGPVPSTTTVLVKPVVPEVLGIRPQPVGTPTLTIISADPRTGRRRAVVHELGGEEPEARSTGLRVVRVRVAR